MPYKEILIGDEARKAIKQGFDIVADAVKITIGPKGRNVIIDNGGEDPEVTNDGVSVAEAISVKDRFINVGVKKAKAIARKVNNLVGDTTSTSLVLGQAFLNEGMRSTMSGLSVIGIRQGMQQAAKEIADALKAMSRKIKSQAELRKVAVTSAESEEIGNIIADTIQKVGKDGAVTVEESHAFGISSEIVEGLQFDQGYISNYMVTHKQKKEAECINAQILVTDYKISSFNQLVPIMEKIQISGKKELVIICEDMDGEALAATMVNKLQGVFNTLAIKAPGYGARKKEQLQDIATFLGASFISSDMGMKLEDVKIENLGKAKKVITKKDNTTIIGGGGKSSIIKARIRDLQDQKKEAKSYEIEALNQRIGKLSNGVAVIKVGATTETEMLYLKKKIEDAVNATKSAIEEGIVPGGGVALVRAAEYVRKDGTCDIPEIKMGYDIVINGCYEPLRQIAVNADRGDGSTVVDRISAHTAGYGYNALKDEFVGDMVKEGIIDSVKAMRTAVEVAAGEVAILLTVGRLMVEIPDEVKQYPPMR